MIPFVLLALVAGGCTEDPWTAAGVSRLSNAPAPRLALADVSGDSVQLQTLRGRVVILYFWTTTCERCAREWFWLNALHRELNAAGLTLLLVNVGETPGTVDRTLQVRRYGARVLLDVECRAAALYGVETIPTVFLLGRDGMVRGRTVGAKDWSSPAIYSLLESLLREPTGPGPAPSPGRPLLSPSETSSAGPSRTSDAVDCGQDLERRW